MHSSMKKVVAVFLTSIVFASIFTVLIVPFKCAEASSGLLTGNIYDQGVDRDGNGLFDCLQIRVEVNVLTAGYYSVSVSGLEGTASDNTTTTAYLYDSVMVFLDVGLRTASVSFHGPAIYNSRIEDASKVKSVSLSGQGFSDWLSDIPLSTTYSYNQFDSASNNMEAKIVVYPNGTLGLAGIMDAARLPYVYKGPTIEEFLNLSKSNDLTVVSERGKITLPSEIGAMWPFNATEISALAEYSEDILTAGVNTTVVLPKGSFQNPYAYPYYYPYPIWLAPLYYPYTYKYEYPFNSSDFAFNLGFSNGILNGELDASSVLPPTASSMFPFNATDFTLKADYQNGLLKGNATFHVMPGTPLGDLNLNFEGDRAYLTAQGTLTVIYGTFPAYPYPIEINETVVDRLIADMTQLEGRGPTSLYNATEGYIELDPATSIGKSPLDSSGVTLAFNIIVRGDLVAFPALFIPGVLGTTSRANDITFRGTYRLLNSTLASVNSASLQFSYAHISKTALLKFRFAADPEELLTSLIAFPEGTQPFAMASGSMRPALDVGDIVLIESIPSVSEITAAPYTGDIIAFNSPRMQNEIVVHRAIYKEFHEGLWYFRTQGDANSAPDNWYGSDTWSGMISQNRVVGKVVERIPWIGYPFLMARIPLQHEDYPAIIKSLLALVKSFSLWASYKSVSRTLELRVSLAFDAKGLWDKAIIELPKWIHYSYPSMESLLTKFLNNLYAEVRSADAWFEYNRGEENHGAIVQIEGDLNREVNMLKEIYISALVKSYEDYHIPVSWHWYFLNQTSLNIDTMKLSFKMGETSLYVRIEDLMASPPIDRIDETSFKLNRFFNVTAPIYPYQREPPTSGEQLRITVQGASNITHAVTLSRPGTVPLPDFVSTDGNTMTWYNQSFSHLRDLTFRTQTQKYGLRVLVADKSGNPIPNASVQIKWPNGTVFKTQTTNDYGHTAETVVDYAYMPFGTYLVTADYLGVSNTQLFIVDHDGVYVVSLAVKGPQIVAAIDDPSLVTVTNPFTINAKEYAASVLVVNQISKPVTIAVRNVTLPTGVTPPSSVWMILGKCVEIIANESDISVNATLRMYYTLEELAAAGLDESTLTIHYWDAAKGEWVKVDSQVNTAEHCVWADISHFSLWVIMGQQRAQLWMQPWFLAVIIGVALAAAIAIAVFATRRKKQVAPPSLSSKP